MPPPSLSVIDDNLVTPWNWNTQVGYRRELTRGLGLDVSFVYNRGYDQIGIINTNAGRPGTANINFYTNFGEIRYKGLIERCSV